MSSENKVIETIFKLKRGVASRWTEVNPILEAGEPGFELDTNKLKIGNGINPWNELPYIVSTDLLSQGQNEVVLSGGSASDNI